MTFDPIKMQENSDTTGLWRKFYRQRRLFFLLWAGWPVVGTVIVLSMGEQLANRLVFPMFAVYAVLFVVSGYILARYPCPRCGRPLGNGIAHWYKPKCRHCGLKAHQEAEASIK
jgi:hypothetical protein